MKKIIIALFFTALLWATFGANGAFAQAPIRYYDWDSTLKTDSTRVLGVSSSSGSLSPQDYKRFNRYFVGKDFYPNNPFYFLKRLQENLQFVLTFDPKAKEEMRLELAGQRLEEMQKMADQAQAGPVSTAAENYQSIMEDVAKNIGGLASTVGTEAAKHGVVLHEVATIVPTQGEQAIQEALEASEKSADAIADLTGRPAIPPDLVDRITALKAQGLLTPEEAAKLISLKTREEARQELRKYANEGILPKADLLRMNEQMKTAFPDDFYRIHEVERFMEMKKLESQKPDPTIQTKIQEFAKTYKSGDIIPADIRSYWAPIIRLEEVQNTFRPDLINPSIFKNNPDEGKKFKEIVERYRPRQEDIDFVNKYITQNKTSVDQLPPEYQRMYNLGQTYGVQTATPPSSDKQPAAISCPSNAHFVPLSTAPNGGYCIPNYTPRFADQQNSGYQDTPCPGGYHRNYAGGACIQDYNQTTSGYLPPLTNTPGNYPSPFYSPSASQCGPGARWVPEPINPQGGYCVGGSPESASYQGSSPSRESQEAACKAGGGTCVSWVNGACGCERPNTGSTAGGCQMPQGGCGGDGRWWDSTSCYCREQGSYPSACTYPSNGCPANMNWDSRSCSCVQSANSNSGTNNYNPPPTGYGSCSSGQYWNGSTCVNNSTPSSEQSSSPTSPSRESQEAACRSGGGTCVSWVNDACGCERPGDTNSQPAPTSQPEQQPAPTSPPPTSPPEQQPTAAP